MPAPRASVSNRSHIQANLISVQIEELLREQSLNHGSHTQKIEGLLVDLQRTIRTLPPANWLPATDLEDSLNPGSAVKLPLSHFIPPASTQLRYGFVPPTEVKLVGSFLSSTGVRHDQDSHIDLLVTMPGHLLEEKDFLDYRYFHKRAYYLAYLVDGLESNLGYAIKLSYSYEDDNELQPSILVTPRASFIQEGQRWNRVRILAGPPTTAFKWQKLQPWLSCIRVQSTSKDADQKESKSPTPLYNGTILSDSVLESYDSLLTETSQGTPKFRDACKLMRVWLRQRDFGSGLKSGGFGHFEAACCLALLLKEKDFLPSTLSKGSDALQLFMSLIQFLASRDLVHEPLALGKQTKILHELNISLPLLYDTERQHNVFFKMSRASFQSLKSAAQTTVEAFTYPKPLRLYPIFIAKTDGVFDRYDHVLAGTFISQPGTMLQQLDAIYNVLTTAFTDRMHLVDIRYQIHPRATEWSCSSLPPSTLPEHTIIIGLMANFSQVSRRVDLGPAAEEIQRAKEFRDFWGEAVELRRFANGEIRESVTWPDPEDDEDTINRIVTHIIKRHFPHGTVKLSQCLGAAYNALGLHTARVQALLPFEKVERAFQQLQECIWAVSGHPLRLRQIYASGAALRYASLTAHKSHASLESRHDLDVLIQFEGSLRWPEDMQAIQHTKIALLSKMGVVLDSDSRISHNRVGLENTRSPLFNQSFLDVTLLGFTFKLRIHHDREESLLGRLITNKSLHLNGKEMAVDALFAYKRNFIYSAKHTQAIRELCAKMTLLSPAMRIMKLWVSSHLLSSHFSEELLEMIVVHSFTFPYPNRSPGSLRSAFLRSLAVISKWDWQNEPLIVDFAGKALSAADVDSALRHFQDWRKTDPAMHRVTLFAASSIEHDGTAWTSPRPSIVAINRLVALANAARKEVANQGLAFALESLFARTLKEYDFVIHLHQKHSRTPELGSPLANSATEDQAVHAFIDELERIFSGYICFFHDWGARPVIGGLWLPRLEGQIWKAGVSWGTVPGMHPNLNGDGINFNFSEVLGQIARLGGDLVLRITQHGTNSSIS